MNRCDVKQFHDDLKAAVIAGVPVEVRSVHCRGGLSLSKLTKWERLIDSGVQRNETLEQIFDSQPELPIRYRAALQVFQRTGSMTAVLDGLTVGELGRQKTTRIRRWASGYLLLVLATAMAGLSMFAARAIPAVDEMRADMVTLESFDVPERFDLLPWIPTMVGALGVMIGLLLVMIMTGGMSRSAMWPGGRRFVRCRTSLRVLEVVQILVARGMKVSPAVSLSCDLTDADAKVREEIQAAVQGVDGESNLGVLARYLRESSNQQLAQLRITTPLAMVAGVGGCIGLVYCLVIFWPIVTLLKDLAIAGT